MNGSSAVGKDLFDVIGAEYNKINPNGSDMGELMESWTTTAGYPVINVECDYNTGEATLTQARFFQNEKDVDSDVPPTRWHIPYTFKSKTLPDSETSFMLKDDNNPTKVQFGSGNTWILLNLNQTGFYRVNYDTLTWHRLSEQLNTDLNEIYLLNRAQLLNDAFALARANKLDYRVALDMTTYLTKEEDYIPWSAALQSLSYIHKRLEGSRHSEQFKQYVLSLLKNTYGILGWEETVIGKPNLHVSKLHRNLVLTWACELGLPECIKDAERFFKLFKGSDGKSKVSADLKTIVYCEGVRTGGATAFDFLWEQFKSSNVATEQTLILGALGCTTHETSAHKLIAKSLDLGPDILEEKNDIRAQDRSLVLPSLYAHYEGVNLVISFLEKNFPDKIRPDQAIGIISGVAGALSTKEQLEKLTTFTNSNMDKLGDEEKVKEALKNSDHNLEWTEKHGEAIANWAKPLNTRRLPQDVTPHLYKLMIDLTESLQTLTGTVDITVTAQTTKDIHLHASDMTITEVEVIPVGDDPPVEVLMFTQYEATQLCRISLVDDLLAETNYTIKLKFDGHLREDMYGFYRSSYMEGEEKKLLAATQFQPTYARRAFPCFDEPEWKAHFDITIQHPIKYKAVSNMKQISAVKIAENTTDTTFERTPKMSTYLVAFVVSEFDPIGEENFQILARKEVKNRTTFALGVTPKVLEALEGFTGITYNLPKLDQVAIPDFSAGAMENWGLVTYRENLLLIDETMSSNSDKIAVATTIAHEFAHQWFGNLVSPKWWSCAWLNEGFATYFQYIALIEDYSDWNLEGQMVVATVQKAFAADDSDSFSALTSEVTTPEEIMLKFDTITYSKGGAVIRMMEHFLTHDVFKKGLTAYLTDYEYSAVNPEDLFMKLQHQVDTDITDANINVKDIMDTWTTQKGFPVVRVDRVYDDTRRATITQERFLMKESNDAIDYIWRIPLTYTSQGEPDFKNTSTSHWLNERKMNIEFLEIINEATWVLFNVKQTGYYRVNYDTVNWRLLTEQLKKDHEGISAVNRAQLIDDSMNLARAGLVHYEVALNLLSYLNRERDYTPWLAASNALQFLFSRYNGGFTTSDETAVFKHFLTHLIGETYASLGFSGRDDDNAITWIHRRDVAKWACQLDNRDCVDRSKTQFRDQMDHPDENSIQPDMAQVVCCTAIQKGGEKEWNFLWDRYNDEKSVISQSVILSALGCSTNHTTLINYLKLSISETSGIRKQDASSVFTSVYSNPKSVSIAFEFLKSNLDDILKYYGGMGTVGNVIHGLATKLQTNDQAEALKKLVTDNRDSLTSVLPLVEKAVEEVRENAKWVNKFQVNIKAWFEYWESMQDESTTTTPKSPSPPTTVTPETTTDNATSITAEFILLVLSIWFSIWATA